jgi:hypothetical protein
MRASKESDSEASSSDEYKSIDSQLDEQEEQETN